MLTFLLVVLGSMPHVAAHVPFWIFAANATLPPWNSFFFVVGLRLVGLSFIENVPLAVWLWPLLSSGKETLAPLTVRTSVMPVGSKSFGRFGIVPLSVQLSWPPPVNFAVP